MSELETWNVQRAYVRPSTTPVKANADGKVLFDTRWVNNGLFTQRWDALPALCEERARLLRKNRWGVDFLPR